MQSDPRSQADAKSRGVGLLVLLGGLAASVLTWRWAAADGHYDVKGALLGPLAIVLGVAFLVHGAEIPLDGITPRTRVYGVLGSLAGIANLYLLGYFQQPRASEVSQLLSLALPVVIVGAWFLPARFYGGTGHVPPKPPDSPIVPR